MIALLTVQKQLSMWDERGVSGHGCREGGQGIGFLVTLSVSWCHWLRERAGTAGGTTGQGHLGSSGQEIMGWSCWGQEVTGLCLC